MYWDLIIVLNVIVIFCKTNLNMILNQLQTFLAPPTMVHSLLIYNKIVRNDTTHNKIVWITLTCKYDHHMISKYVLYFFRNFLSFFACWVSTFHFLSIFCCAILIPYLKMISFQIGRRTTHVTVLH